VAFARFRHSKTWPRLALLLLLAAAGAGWSFAQPGPHTRDSSETSSSGAAASPANAVDAAARASRRAASARLREGTEIREVLGQFIQVDGRFEFVSVDGVYRLRMLENLALERASRKVDESAQSVAWSVSGIVTEYQGANYLLVKRIVVDSGAAHGKE
jgi:hypothetical protein